MLGWRQARPEQNKSTTLPHLISVIIPFRNEKSNLDQLVKDLSNQTLNRDSFEIILVNDHSIDGSLDYLKKRVEGNPTFCLLSLTHENEGKKRALAEGIKQAKGSVIITTDADCRLPTTWLEIIHARFADTSLNMITGAVAIETGNGLFSMLQSMESAGTTGLMSAFSNLNRPVLASGANLAFRKAVYEKVGGYHGNFNIPSGDDEFLLRKIHKEFPGSVHFLNHPDAVVRTEAIESVDAFINQRIRWAGKWKFNKLSLSSMLALFLVLFHIGLFAAIAFALAGKIGAELILSLVVVKLVLEFFLLKPIMKFLQLDWNWPTFLLLQVFYFQYVIIMGFMAQRRSFSWKGRTMQQRMGSAENS